MWLRGLLGIAALALGACHSSAPRPADPAPAWLAPGDVSLTIELAGGGDPSEDPRTVVHRLVNRSSETVCVGGSKELRVDGRGLRLTILRDALCFMPLVSAAPGETVTWTEPWPGTDCMPDAPPELLGAMPSLECGIEVELRSRIWLFRVVDGISQYGGIEIESEPFPVRTAPLPSEGSPTE